MIHNLILGGYIEKITQLFTTIEVYEISLIWFRGLEYMGGIKTAENLHVLFVALHE